MPDNPPPSMDPADDWNGLLGPDERIIWQGAPTGRFRLEFNSVYAFLFMIVWSAFPVGMVIAQPWIIFLGVPTLFLGIALWFFVGQHFWAMHNRRRTFYTLTNKRAFIAKRSLSGRKLQSYPITPQTPLEIQDRSGGAIWFATSETGELFSKQGPRKVGFDQLAAPRTVYSLLQQVQQGAL